MGDALVSEINEAVRYLSRCFSLSANDLKRLEDVKSLNGIFEMMRAKLNDAEQMEITSETSIFYLKQLKKSFYDTEDVLNEFLYRVLQLKSPVDGNVVRVDAGMVDQERDPSSSNNSTGKLAFMDDQVEQIRNLKFRLRRQNKVMDRNANHVQSFKSYQQKPTALRPPSTSLMSSIPPIGRGDDLENIKRLLFSELVGDRNIPVIAIVGMGGLGKTNLAQCVYNDPQVKQHFHLKIWVCVSEDFDLVRLTSAMLESLEQKRCDLSEMDPLQRRLEGIVEGKRLLLVFDDVWEHDNLDAKAWENLCGPLHGVSDGSKIIVTTRSKTLLDRVIIPADIYKLPYLTDDDCFALFIQHAFKGWTSDIDPSLLFIGRRISTKCKGLPLAAENLGRLLRGKAEVEKWNDVLNHSGLWPTDDRNLIMPILRLSYRHLPAKLKKCFRYFSVFPKDYQFQKNQLIGMWMAHGYITRTEREKKQLEDIGEEYINELVSRSLFEQSRNHEIFMMHELNHYLARDVSHGEWWSVENGVCDGNKDDNVQHFSIICTKIYPQEHIEGQSKSRCLLFFNSTLSWSDMKDLCRRMTQLRVLDLSCTTIQNLPDCISDLKYLRYLSLQGNQITDLPEALGSLYLLETLNLNMTKIKILPDSICLLKRLRYLGLGGTCIQYLPESLAKLDRLKTLDVESCKIGHLPDSILKLSSLRLRT